MSEGEGLSEVDGNAINTQRRGAEAVFPQSRKCFAMCTLSSRPTRVQLLANLTPPPTHTHRSHNKGWEEAASSFARQAVRLTTASAALFEAAGRTWQDATAPEVEWRLVQVLTP